MIPFATSSMISQRVMSLTIWIFESFKQIYRFRLQNKHTSLSYTNNHIDTERHSRTKTDQWGVGFILHTHTYTLIRIKIYKKTKTQTNIRNILTLSLTHTQTHRQTFIERHKQTYVARLRQTLALPTQFGMQLLKEMFCFAQHKQHFNVPLSSQG